MELPHRHLFTNQGENLALKSKFVKSHSSPVTDRGKTWHKYSHFFHRRKITFIPTPVLRAYKFPLRLEFQETTKPAGISGYARL